MNRKKILPYFQKSLVVILVVVGMFVAQSAAFVRQAALAGAPPIAANAPRHDKASARQKGMLVRLSEIEINPNDLAKYKAILKEEAEASVRLEPGVVSIFAMNQTENPTQVRILEIYASREAHESHLRTAHFQKYKTATLKMVRALKLVDMEALDTKTMALIFKKVKTSQTSTAR